MIRDEYKQKKKQDYSSREIKKIRKLGERAFYISSINKIKQNIKLFNFSCILAIFCCLLPFIQLLDSILFTPQERVNGYIAFAILCLIYILIIIWFTVILPSLKKKFKKYQNKLQELSIKEVNKFKN